jgi:ArsR family transcriptional regulator
MCHLPNCLGLFQSPGGNLSDGYVRSHIRSVERRMSHLKTRMGSVLSLSHDFEKALPNCLKLLDKLSRLWYNFIVLAYTNMRLMVAMDNIEELADIFKALSDPTRLRLLKLVSECEPGGPTSDECEPGACNGPTFLCVNALAHKLGVTQSAVSQHLRVLRQAGLVRGVRRGSFMHYSLDQEGLARYRAVLHDTLGEDFAM